MNDPKQSAVATRDKEEQEKQQTLQELAELLADNEDYKW